MTLLIRGASQVATPTGHGARRGAELGRLELLPKAVVRCDGGRISLRRRAPPSTTGASRRAGDVLDAGGGCVVPGFVDPHTHLLFAGYREEEFDRRLRGETYAQIAALGRRHRRHGRGHPRAPASDELLERTLARLDASSCTAPRPPRRSPATGSTSTTSSSSSGAPRAGRAPPGRDRAHRHAGATRCRPSGATTRTATSGGVIDEIHPAIAAAAWPRPSTCSASRASSTSTQTRRLLADAARHGWRIHLHADELCHLGGAELAAELGAPSAAHLLHVSGRRHRRPGRGGRGRRRCFPASRSSCATAGRRRASWSTAGVPVALATDCNPGSSHTESHAGDHGPRLPRAGLTVEEALVAATLNAAAALGRAGALGSLEPGKQADLVVLDAPSPSTSSTTSASTWCATSSRPAASWSATAGAPPDPPSCRARVRSRGSDR